MVSYALHFTKNQELRCKIREHYKDFNERYKKYGSFGDALVLRVGLQKLRESIEYGMDCVWKYGEIAGIPSVEIVENDTICKAFFATQVAWVCAKSSLEKDEIALSVLTNKPSSLYKSIQSILSPCEGFTDMLHIIHIQNEELYKKYVEAGFTVFPFKLLGQLNSPHLFDKIKMHRSKLSL
jgi:hypothetical protein